MVRKIVGVVVGYVVMALLIFATFSAAYLVMGADAAFKPGTYEVSGLWLIVSFVLSLVAAAVGGYVCALISRSRKAPLALAGLVLILGILVAIPILTAGADRFKVPREGNVSNMEAMQKAQQPGWVALLNPLIGAAGIIIGARLRQKTNITDPS